VAKPDNHLCNAYAKEEWRQPFVVCNRIPANSLDKIRRAEKEAFAAHCASILGLVA
jgi:hypothetical protein